MLSHARQLQKGRDSSMSALIDARGIEKSFMYGKGKKLRKNRVLNGIDFSVNVGEFVSIVGPSGSGKTTLLNCLSGLEEIDSGSIALDGNLISSMNTIERDEVRRRLVSFVFQNLNLIPSLNAVDNVWIPARLSGKKATKKDALALLSGLGIADKAKDYPDSLSGGERQRLGIARAFLHDADILFLDEPTSNIDSLNEGMILRSLKEECADKTILMVSHRKSTMGIADDVLEM